MFQDEAGFGRINKPKNCWAPLGIRPCVPCHHIREYRYAYGAVEPLTGESSFLVLPWASTLCMNLFLCELSKAFPQDMILLGVDRASWHTAKKLIIPDNIQLFYLLAYTLEMNPIHNSKYSKNAIQTLLPPSIRVNYSIKHRRYKVSKDFVAPCFLLFFQVNNAKMLLFCHNFPASTA